MNIYIYMYIESKPKITCLYLNVSIKILISTDKDFNRHVYIQASVFLVYSLDAFYILRGCGLESV